jgi:trigger factor
MTMPTTVEETDRHKVKLTVEVPPDRIGKDLDAAYRRIAQQVKVPGFRKGKAPRKVIDAQIGRDAVVAEFLDEAVPVYYREAVREHELAPIADPDLDLGDLGGLDEGKPFVFTATVEVRPRLQLEESDYQGVKVERPSAEVSDGEVDELLDRLRDRFAELDPVPRAAKEGDYVVIDLRASVHGAEIAEATRPDFLYEVGSGEFVDELDRELQGKRAGEILKFNAVLPERFGERAGQEVSFQVLVKEVKAKRRPVADDAFAKTASEFDTLEELRESLREQLRQNKEGAAGAAVRDRALQALVDAVDVELPDSLVDEETEHRVQHGRERAEQAGLTLQQVLEAQGFDELRFRSDARAHAVRAIKADLVLEAVARREGIQVTTEEIGNEIAALAASLGRDPKEVARTLERTGQVVTLAGDIIRSKALDLIVEHADIVSEGERRAADLVSVEAEAPSEPPQQDRSEEQSSHE